MAEELYLIQYAPEVTVQKRAEIARRLMNLSPNIQKETFTRLDVSDLELLFRLYNEVFFEKRFESVFSGELKFSLSSRLTRSAGKTLCPKNIARLRPETVMIEVRIGLEFFLRYHELPGDKTVSGIVTHHALEALQVVFEHELCHVLEFIYFHRSNCRGSRFKMMAYRIFGHTDSYHHLPTPNAIAREKYGLKPGDRVSFVFAERILTGIIYAINKRATVMVEDKKGPFIDRRGQRYQKYYVPVEKLKRM